MKLIFDANVSPHAVAALGELLQKSKEEGEIRHLVQDFPQGTPDSEFIPRYAKGGYLLITGDSAKQSGKKDRLPAICQSEGLRHVLFTGRLQKRRTFDKMRAVISVWPELQRASTAAEGARFKLQQSGEGFVLKAA